MNILLRYLNKLLNVVVIGTLAALVIIVFANVVLRYFFHSGFSWTVEVSGLLFVWLIFLGTVMAMRDYGHLGVDLLVAKLPRTAQKVMFTLMNGIIIAASALFVDGVVNTMLLNGWMPGSATPIPVNAMYAAGLVAGVLLILISTVQIVRFVFLGTDAPPWATGTTAAEEVTGE